MRTPQETIKIITGEDESTYPEFFSKKELFLFMTEHAKYEEELYLKTNEENLRCLSILQDFVQEHIVPLDPAVIIGHLGTLDSAIKFYFFYLGKEKDKMIDAHKQLTEQQGSLLARAVMLIKEFADRVEKGEIRSVKTYKKYKDFLKEVGAE